MLIDGQAFRVHLEGAAGRLQVLHTATTLYGGTEELAARSHEFINICTRIPTRQVHNNECAHDDGRSYMERASQPPDAEAGDAGGAAERSVQVGIPG